MSMLMMLSCEQPNTGHVTVKTEFPGRVPYANVLSASYTVLNYYSFCIKTRVLAFLLQII